MTMAGGFGYEQVYNSPQGGSMWTALQQYQMNLQSFDRQAMTALARTYKEIQPDFQSTLSALDQQIRTAKASGLQPSASWVFQQQRYRALEQQVLSASGKLAIVTGGEADKAAMRAITAQNKFLEALASGQAEFGDTGDLRTWATLPSRTLESFIGLSKGSPLLEKFASESGRDAMRAMRNTLAGHIATGRPARVTARLMQSRVAGLTLTRAMTITRTEAARARRAAALATFQRNPAVRGWVWRAELDKSCPACIALHGQEFPTDEFQAGHPNCRCVMVPMRHRGINPDVGTGSDYLLNKFRAGGYNAGALAKQLGRGRANAWKAELDRLMDTGMPVGLAAKGATTRMVQLVPNAAYGGMYRPVPVWQLRGGPPPGTRLPGTPQPAPPTGGFNAKPDYDSTVQAEKQFLAQGADPSDWSAAGQNKAAAQDAVFRKVQADPDMRAWALKEYNRRNGTTFSNLGDVDYEAIMKQEIRSMVDTWAGTSGDSSGRAVALQYAARREFGLNSASVKHFGKDQWDPNGYGRFSTYDDWFRAEVQPMLDRYESFDRRILRAQYEVTQDAFRQQGITHVTLFRSAGQNWESGSVLDRIERASAAGTGDTYIGNLSLQPLSSFTTRPSVTGGFGNVFYQTTVPVEYIHSTARTGLGCLSEYEWVVMGIDDAPATMTALAKVQANYNFWQWQPGGRTQSWGVPITTPDAQWVSDVPLP